MLGPIRWFWRTLRRPSVHFSLGFLTFGGFIAGVLFWGGFNTALEATNREAFCVSCHEMRDNVYTELKTTPHWSNASGVRAQCPDCHVPHEWTDKIARKVAASKEVWGAIFGTIDTREKFLDHRLAMASREWSRMTHNDSLECRNCHSADSMDLTQQNPRAQEAHETFLLTDQKTCIDCHKGIAHELPDMAGVPGWQ
ncbi:NapC/NirT family cytochrome c [Jiella marina]|uniref:NapC/NirT family cytochrome c n=1 Tax=Jiella sp. LLJ827 TaxID=2917712 RepID=UPI0021007F35|nr:NapC/NirT family cytochrome c [Jiella sp. LLJ827]MCQ0988823.1 NapC/NirT family cytochrome c [Jiella sp. LLJ827]